MINIVNLLLTRKCNLKCDYCRISGDIDYIISPREYKDSEYYFNNEKSADFWIDYIGRLAKHNRNIFFILYGGEPLLYEGLADIVIYLNQKNLHYTIISNCTLTEKIKIFFENVGRVKGFTASIDPGFWRNENQDYEELKSVMGFEFLKYLVEKNLADDPVAEITTDKNNIKDLVETVRILSEEGIMSDITVIDIAKNNYYDFSSVTDPKHLVPKDERTKDIFDELIESNYRIHMKKQLLPKIYDILPSELDCKIEEDLHNITIDSDGTLRLCLRIKGREVPKIRLNELFNEDGSETDIADSIRVCYKQDKLTLCKKCNHGCLLMSQLLYEGVIDH